MVNYIVDLNKFQLSGPPVWFLQRLWDFDSSLVIVPSRQSCVYRLAQRRKLTLPENIVNEALFKQSDTQMLASYNLVPVTSIIATVNWSNPFIFEELRKRAPHRLGGAEAVNKMLDEQDEKDELDRRAATDDHLTYLSKDAWNLYLKKVGLRSHMYSPKTANTRPAEKSASLRFT